MSSDQLLELFTRLPQGEEPILDQGDGRPYVGLVSLPEHDGQRDYYLVCAAGHASRPLLHLPAIRICSACEADRQGRENFRRLTGRN